MTNDTPAPRLLLTGFRPGPAGVGRVMMNLINGFRRERVDVHVLVSAGEYPELRNANGRTEIHQFPLSLDRQTVRRIRSFLAELAPDVVLSNRDEASELVIRARAGLEPAPRILLRVGTDVPAKLRHYRNPLARWRRAMRIKRICRRADAIIGITAGVVRGLQILLGRNAPPIETIYNPLDIGVCRSSAREEPDHPWFRVRQGRLLVSVGRLARVKDQATMLRALALLPSDFRLVIFGEGPQRERLLSFARELGVAARFDLPGHTDNPFAHVARADVFLLTSRFEGISNALLESLAVGTPAVSTDCPSGPRELLGYGRYGMLVPVAHPRALADAVLHILERPPSDERLAESLVRFDLNHAVQEYLRVMGFRATTQGGESG